MQITPGGVIPQAVTNEQHTPTGAKGTLSKRTGMKSGESGWGKWQQLKLVNREEGRGAPACLPPELQALGPTPSLAFLVGHLLLSTWVLGNKEGQVLHSPPPETFLHELLEPFYVKAHGIHPGTKMEMSVPPCRVWAGTLEVILQGWKATCPRSHSKLVTEPGQGAVAPPPGPWHRPHSQDGLWDFKHWITTSLPSARITEGWLCPRSEGMYD